MADRKTGRPTPALFRGTDSHGDGLEAQNANQSERISRALAEIAHLKTEIVNEQRQAEFRKQPLDVMRETLADRVQSSA